MPYAKDRVDRLFQFWPWGWIHIRDEFFSGKSTCSFVFKSKSRLKVWGFLCNWLICWGGCFLDFSVHHVEKKLAIDVSSRHPRNILCTCYTWETNDESGTQNASSFRIIRYILTIYAVWIILPNIIDSQLTLFFDSNNNYFILVWWDRIFYLTNCSCARIISRSNFRHKWYRGKIFNGIIRTYYASFERIYLPNLIVVGSKTDKIKY